MLKKIKEFFAYIFKPFKAVFMHIVYEPIQAEITKERKAELLNEEAFRLHNSFGYLEQVQKEDLYFWEKPNYNKKFDAAVDQWYEEHQKNVRDHPELFPTPQVDSIMRDLARSNKNQIRFLKFLFTWKGKYRGKIQPLTKKELFIKAKELYVLGNLAKIKQQDAFVDFKWYLLTGIKPVPYNCDVSTYSLYKKAKFFKIIKNNIIYRRYLISKFKKLLRLFFKKRQFFLNWDVIYFCDDVLIRHHAIPRNEIHFDEIDFTFVFGFDLSDSLYEKLIHLIKTMLYNGYSMEMINQKLCFIFNGNIKNKFFTNTEFLAIDERYETIKQEILATRKVELFEFPDYDKFVFLLKYLKDKYRYWYFIYYDFFSYFSTKNIGKRKKKKSK